MRIRLVLILFVSLLSTPLALYAQANDPEPSMDEFIDVEKEPQPLSPIEKNVEYPETARRAGLEGKVIVNILIDKDGSVSKAVVMKSDYDIFKPAAINAIRATRFTPAIQNGKPIRVWMTKTINFKLTAPPGDDPSIFLKLMSLSEDSMRTALASLGEIHESKVGTDRVLSAAAEDSLSHGKAPGYMSVTYGPAGARSMIVGFRHVTMEQFKNIGMTFGNALNWHVQCEFPEMFLNMIVDVPSRSYEMQITRK